MKINLRKILKKIATLGFSAVAVAATAGTAFLPGKNGGVHAEEGRDQAVVDAFNEVKVEGIYGYGTPNNWNGIAAQTGGQRKAATTDCSRTTAYIVSHFLQKMGMPGTSNPDWDVASTSASVWGPGLQGVAAANKIQVQDLGTDFTNAQPGDVLLYEGAHVAVYGGGDITYDAQSGRLGGSNGVHENHGLLGSAGSDSNPKPLTHIYHFVLTKTVKKTIEITKVSANTTITNGNPNYSLAGAVFDVYNGDNTKLGSMTTGADGKASFSYTWTGVPQSESEDLLKYQLHAVEMTASKGFKVVGGSYKTGANVPEPDRNDPASIQITKRSDDGDVVKHPQELKNAEFTLKFYAVDPNTDVSKLPASPTRTWKLTPKNKVVDDKTGADAYRGYLAEATGDALYTERGKTVLPIGVLTIQETKAPEGYKKTENKYITVQNQNLTVNENGIVALRIFSDTSSSGASVNFGHEANKPDSDVSYDVNDKNVRQGIRVTKYDYDLRKNQTQGDAPDLRAHFVIIKDNDYGVASIDANGTKRAAAGKAENRVRNASLIGGTCQVINRSAHAGCLW